MNQETIKAVALEIEQVLSGRILGTVHQIDSYSVVLDFRLRENGYLLVSADPKRPRMYLITRRAKEIERASITAAPFTQFIRSALRGARLISARPDPLERIVSLTFLRQLETGEDQNLRLMFQLTGRSANMFILDADGVIQHALRRPRGTGQQVGDLYEPPPPHETLASESTPVKGSHSISAALDEYFTQLGVSEGFAARVQAIRERYQRQIAQKKRLQVNLSSDLSKHGAALEHKRLGDLLLANLGTAKRKGRRVVIQDYYAEGTPELEIDVDEQISLKDEAARSFARYGKAKRAQDEIARRLDQTALDITGLEQHLRHLDRIFAAHDEAALSELEGKHTQAAPKHSKQGQSEKLPGIRRYRSSDDYEILVGKAAQTNDRLTFKIARPNDLWFHAADYPGSHVIIRNSSRKDVPHRTIIEAAQIAARFSQAGDDSKVKVNYTQRKYLSKPRGAAPGLVRLSRFKSITVTPREDLERIR
ncbi:MAG TPA: NFACT RNA binding domain-containing protein [Pyrinomonadaceae bacterium]|nr:NFACT RNA binding domain-containing protein [Pyrinomonadaceae bacterium]